MTPKKKALSGKEAVAVGVIVAFLVAALVSLSALFTMFAWNVGVGAVVAASGGSVGNIGFLAALAFNIALGIVSRPFRRAPVAAKTD